jgi:uncharacterized protein involved in exopolysaccharide biosynthesis
VREYLAAVKHQKMWLVVTIAAGLLLSIVLAVTLPARYRSAGTILIEQQEIPQDMVRSTVTSYAAERVQVISKRVMTTETLLNIIRRYDLYPKERAKATREELLGKMRNDIGLRMISADVIDPRSGHPTEATVAFEVSYTGVSPDLAARVANELTTLYLNENLNNRTQRARDATQFLESEGDRISHQITDLEAQLARFKDKHLHELPDLVQLNMSLLDRTQEEIRNAESRQTALKQQKVFLEAQLSMIKPNSVVLSDTGERITSTADRLKMARSQLDSLRAIYAPDHPDIITLQREVQGLEKQLAASGEADDPATLAGEADGANDLGRRLEQAQAQLEQARQRYTPDHPDRRRLERQVAELQKEVAAAPKIREPASLVTPTHADNPAYVEIRSQLSATINDLKAGEEELVKLRAQAAGYEQHVSLSPEVEQEYRQLVRDYDNARLKYQDLRSKQVEARTAQDLEADRQGERFTLIDPPLPPETPVSPNRKLILGVGMVLSLGLAAGLLWLLERLDTSVRGRADLYQLLGVPALALVPRILTEADRLEGQRRRRIAAGASAATLCLAVVLVHFLYRPLDVLWFQVMHTFGLSE